MDKSIPGDGLGAEFGGAFDGVRLRGADSLKDGLRLVKIFESRVGHFFTLRRTSRRFEQKAGLN